MKISYRKAVMDDMKDIMLIIEDGRSFLKPQNGGQWQDGYPNEETIKEDIKSKNFYVILTDEGKIAAVSAFTYHEDDYDHLYEGAWLSDLPYMVMHRCAVKEKYRGLGYGDQLFKLFELVAKEKGYHSLRVDTHENNVIMLHLANKNGFIRCGKAILTPNKDRIVLEKMI